MPFHRFDDPTYNKLGGTFPGTIGDDSYDRINVTDGGTGGGDGSANCDPQKSGGPNDDTYFVAFGEHGLSGHANRGNKALAENCDSLDNILRENTPMSLGFAGATAGGGGVGSYAVTGGVDVFVGGPGSSTTETTYYALLVDSAGDAIYNGGTRVTISAIEDGSSNNVMGNASASAPDGFHTDPTFIFSSSVPEGVAFRILLASRNTYALLTQEALKYLPHKDRLDEKSIRAALGHLRYYGLNEAYRRYSKVPGGTSGVTMTAQQDVAGDGATITRDGKAVTVVDPNLPVAAKAYIDPWMGLEYLGISGTPVAGSLFTSPATGGSSGLVLELNPYNDVENAHRFKNTSQHSGLLAVCPRDVILSNFGAAPSRLLMTKVDPTLDGFLNPDNDGSTNGRRTIELNSADYFHHISELKTAVKTGFDYLEITFATGEVEVYIIDSIVGYGSEPANRRALLLNLTGNNPDFGAVSVPGTKFRFIQRLVSISTDHMGDTETQSKGRTGFQVLNPNGMTDQPAWVLGLDPASFWAATNDATEGRILSGGTSAVFRNYAYGALRWGGIDRATGLRDLSHVGFLCGDGSIETAGRLEGMSNGRHDIDTAVAGSEVLTWHPMGGFFNQPFEADLIGSVISLRSTAAPGAQTITLNWDTAYTPKRGDRLTLIIENNGGATITMAGTAWGDIQFSEGDDSIPTDVGFIAKYEMVYTLLSSGEKWLATRTSYDLVP